MFLIKTIWVVVLVLCVSCSMREEPHPKAQLYGYPYDMDANERKEVESQAIAGDAEAAYRLALYEMHFDSSEQSLQWFHLACSNGFDRASSSHLGAFEQFERGEISFGIRDDLDSVSKTNSPSRGAEGGIGSDSSL